MDGAAILEPAANCCDRLKKPAPLLNLLTYFLPKLHHQMTDQRADLSLNSSIGHKISLVSLANSIRLPNNSAGKKNLAGQKQPTIKARFEQNK